MKWLMISIEKRERGNRKWRNLTVCRSPTRPVYLFKHLDHHSSPTLFPRKSLFPSNRIALTSEGEKIHSKQAQTFLFRKKKKKNISITNPRSPVSVGGCCRASALAFMYLSRAHTQIDSFLPPLSHSSSIYQSSIWYFIFSAFHKSIETFCTTG